MIKQKLLHSLTNFGQPVITVVDANHHNRAELKLLHQHAGVDLDLEYAHATLTSLYNIWKRPVLIETKLGEQKKIITFDGTEHKVQDTTDGV